MSVGLDADGAIAGKGHRGNRARQTLSLGQGDCDRIFGQSCVIGDGQRACVAGVCQRTNRGRRKLPGGDGRGEDEKCERLRILVR